MTVIELVTFAEVEGIGVVLDGDHIRLRFHGEPRADVVAMFRDRKPEVVSYLRKRNSLPVAKLPFRIVEDNFKTGPVQLSQCEFVTDPFKFAVSTFEQLKAKLANPRRNVGWEVERLLDRLAAVGLVVALELEGKEEASPVDFVGQAISRGKIN